ncbi:hypothetical protein F4861DRAFT_539965 [Xylaria intraflava]|nr:hypothetical protein F4861DRAFT_539965 [Xylaria intraflava]
MCRRIITHHMHHDVAAPMIIDPVASNPTIYANPLRTNYHQCELSLSPPAWLLNSPVKKCTYHSCCAPEEEVEFCAELLASLDGDYDAEPEECANFVLEHHHGRLPYFGHEEDYDDSVPATWRGLENIRARRPEWFPDFAHDPQYRARWEETCFMACERLCVLEADAQMLFAVSVDLSQGGLAYWSGYARTARADFLAASARLQEQRALVNDIFEWALGYGGSCPMEGF